MSHNKQLILLCMDGASLSVLEPLVSKGYLPAFSDAFHTGVYGNLYVDPNERGWPNILTGLPVDQLGSFYYWRDQGHYLPQMIYDNSFLAQKTFLDKCSKSGLKILSINLPLTYPAWSINGAMVSGGGGGTNPEIQKAVYPSRLLSQYADYFNSYTIDLRKNSYAGKSPLLFVQDLLETTRKRIELTKILLTNESWDLALPTFVGFDRLQHWLWDALPEIGNSQNEKLTPLILDYFLLIDSFLSYIQKEHPGAEIMAVSDHGFQKIDHYLYLNSILATHGFLKQNNSIGAKAVKYMKKVARKFPGLKTKVVSGKKAAFFSETAFRNSVNWSKTVAYGFRAPGVYLNLNKSQEGSMEGHSEACTKTIEVLTHVLGKFKIDDVPVFSNFRKQADQYEGAKKYLAPDLLFDVLLETEILPAKPGSNVHFEKRKVYTDWSLMPTVRQGIHSSQALFMAIGPSFSPQKLSEGYNLIDFSATILDYFGIKDPGQDGNSILPDIQNAS